MSDAPKAAAPASAPKRAAQNVRASDPATARGAHPRSGQQIVNEPPRGRGRIDLSDPGAQVLSGEEMLSQIQKNVADGEPKTGHDKPRGKDGTFRQSVRQRAREAAARTESALDSAFDAVNGKKTTPKPQADEAPQRDGEDEGEAEDGQNASQTSERPPSKELEKALKHLRLAQWSDKDFEGMSEQQLIDHGNREAKLQAGVSERLRAASKHEPQATATDGKNDQPKPGTDLRGSAHATDAEDDTELIAKLVPLSKSLSDLYGEEEFGRPLAEFVAKATREVLGERLRAIEDFQGQLAADRVVASLRGRYPQAEKQDGRDALIEKTRALMAGGGYENVFDAANDAGMVLWGKQQLEEAAAQPAPAPRQRAPRSTAPLRESRGASMGPKSMDQRLDAAIDAALGDGDVERAFGRRG